jgi:hypothetical protein
MGYGVLQSVAFTESESVAMSQKTPAHDPASTTPADDTPEYPLSAPIKPDDPERRSEQSRAETEGCAEEPQDPEPDRNT